MTSEQPQFRFPNRIAAIRDVIDAANYDGMLISNRENRRYLSGFIGSAGYLLITPTKARLVTDFRYTEQAAIQAPGFDVVQQKGRLADWFPQAVQDADVSVLAFEADDMTVDAIERLRTALQPPPPTDAAEQTGPDNDADTAPADSDAAQEAGSDINAEPPTSASDTTPEAASHSDADTANAAVDATEQGSPPDDSADPATADADAAEQGSAEVDAADPETADADAAEQGSAPDAAADNATAEDDDVAAEPAPEVADPACDLLPTPEPIAVMVPAKGHTVKLRAVKEADELAALQRAIDVGDAAFSETLSKLRVGMTEREAAWEFEKAVRQRGAESISFDTIVASGPNAARPHHQTGDRKLAAGETIVFDCGARLDGYCSDLTRTVVLGDPDAAIIRVYGIVLEAQLAAIRGAQAGMTGEQVDEIARKIIRDAGHADDFGHSLGHGLGLEVHEEPHVGPRADNVLQVGMPFTIEPGLYIPHWGGVRIEDVVVLEPTGTRVLSHAPKARY